MRIYLGSDHRGFQLKEKIKRWLTDTQPAVVDLGNAVYDPEDDFPDFAFAVASRVAGSDDVGILLCGSGGMALVANKVRGIRAVEVSDERRAAHAKSDDHANIIALPADEVSFGQATKIISAWLDASPKRDRKYLRRLRKIEALERMVFKA
ncbi:MAG: hypothetical protein A2900_00260 [Candidatus Chisholmbacteria bacterium RIFCSPLOWO2_01_FULL_50_28]|uniref:Ribose-5-phosphate isomerase n=1 Tax=Candidatus Chisholmbacteria bacterium RIFCSPHIGHO2_01_FULL_52_32 TaxID=1797591 RepID=A0A1G1VR07_9BACT|nr:MAG: hypothetical protein A2786_00605 [Candidatus Chisholmbacteria bacterium RIFCSPHIGHO2_01_FULL_52_32]OGY19537.1 MAG: hypothetical protein A2900_00260 [Candidatus Chisholmbacteria bacterium RIFCSPLOWO2_01_FULL_50_28]